MKKVLLLLYMALSLSSYSQWSGVISNAPLIVSAPDEESPFFDIQSFSDSLFVPNAFYDSTIIYFSIAANDTVTLQLFDRWGAAVIKFFQDTLMSAGSYLVELKGDSLQPGTYTLTLKLSGNKNFVKQVLKINQLTDVFQIRNPKSEIRILPNPATTYITIQLQQTPSSPTALQLFDITGRMILQKQLTAQTNTVELSGVSKGMYLYSVLRQAQHDTERLGAGKLIVE